MTKIKTSSWVLIGIMAVSLFFGIFSLSFTEIQTKLLPLAVSWFIFLMSGIEFVREYRATKKANLVETPKSKKPGKSNSTKNELTQFVKPFSWVLIFTAAVYLVGFLVSIPLFVFIYLKYVSNRGWLISGGLALGLTGMIFGLFVYALKTQMYPGILFGGRF